MTHSTYPIIDLTFIAAADLRLYQYFLVEAGTTEGTVQLHQTAHAYPIGVLRNKPNTGETAVVRVIGVTELATYTTVAWGAAIGPHNSGSSAYTPDGYGVTASAGGTAVVFGKCLNASGSTAGNYCTAAVSFIVPTVMVTPST
jgi:hypothetical protein